MSNLIALVAAGAALLGCVAWLIQRNAGRRRQREELHRAKDELEAGIDQRTSDLRDSSARLQSIIDSAVDGIIVIDAKGRIDFSSEQAEARDLLDSNHLYRVSSQQAGDPQVARLLDQLGRVLAEIANGPAEVSAGDLEQVRHTIQSEGLLFKVRVVGSEVNSRARRPELSGSSVNQRL